MIALAALLALAAGAAGRPGSGSRADEPAAGDPKAGDPKGAITLPKDPNPDYSYPPNLLPQLTRIGGIGSLGKLQVGYE
jgi:hypothetical protein